MQHTNKHSFTIFLLTHPTITYLQTIKIQNLTIT